VDENLFVLLVDETMDVLRSHEYLLLVVGVGVRDWEVHGSVDLVLSILSHLLLPVYSHFSHLIVRLKVDNSADVVILQILDLACGEWVWSKGDVQVTNLRDDEVSVEESVHLVDHSVNEEDLTGVNELMGVVLSELPGVPL